VSDKQIALARKFQYAEITSFSKAIKAFANRDNATIETWKRALSAKTAMQNLTPSDTWEYNAI